MEKQRSDILMAIIEHGSRPVAYTIIALLTFLFLFSIKGPAFDLMKDAQELKIGSFEVRLRADVDLYGLNNELTALQTLNDQQIQLFLVVGKRREHITYIGEEVTQENLDALYKAGLLSEVTKEKNGDFFWYVSEKGHQLHNLIFQQVTKAISRG
jgi:hypothetical protein